MQPSPTWPAPLDAVGLALVSVLLLLGMYRGLWWQVMRLLGVTLSVLAARAFGSPLSGRLQVFFPELEPRTAHGIAWASLFLIALASCALLGLLGQRVLEAMRLDLANRLAGACAGAATGACAHVALVVMVCQLAPEPVLGQYVSGTYSERVYTALGLRWSVVLAADAAQEVDQALERAPQHASPGPHEPPPELPPESGGGGVVR